MVTVRDFGARGDGRTDDTAALSHAVQQGEGHLIFPRGEYVISRPLHVPLHLHGRVSIDGSGIYFDRVNLHQTNVHGNHISYCKQGGLKVVGSEIRNLQICSNDIEYNYDLKVPDCCDILLDCRAGTVREGTIVGNTIQARE